MVSTRFNNRRWHDQDQKPLTISKVGDVWRYAAALSGCCAPWRGTAKRGIRAAAHVLGVFL
jgi:hypothetical protein